MNKDSKNQLQAQLATQQQPLQQAISETKMLQISATSTRLENEPECICNQQPQNQDSSVQLELQKNQSMPQ
jgi:hypothetical protein